MRSGQRFDQRGFPVIDVAGRANNYALRRGSHDSNRRTRLPLSMLLEERIGGQTGATISQRRFRRRSLARRRADRARQEWACQLSENRRRHESLPWELLSAPDLLIGIPPVNPLDERRAWRSRNHGRKPCEWPWPLARKQRRRPPPRFSRAAPAAPLAIWARRQFRLPS